MSGDRYPNTSWGRVDQSSIIILYESKEEDTMPLGLDCHFVLTSPHGFHYKWFTLCIDTELSKRLLVGNMHDKLKFLIVFI